MASSKSEHQAVMLLSPQRILKDYFILESLHINKSPKGITYTTNELTNGELRSFYSHLPAQAKDAFMHFTPDFILFKKDDVKKRFNSQRSGMDFDSYSKTAMIRRLHESLERLKPFATMTKWYHKIQQDKGVFKTAPCHFSAYKPKLTFEVKKHEDNLVLETSVALNETAYPLSHFTRYEFLLESKNEYFLLTYKDYQTLEWLETNDSQQFSTQPDEFAVNILGRIETDYIVNRNNLFAKNEINVLPQNRVLLSEISQSFIVLTPQWLYDDFLIEGTWKEQQETISNNKTYIIKRNRDAENTFVKMLESLHPNFTRQLNGYYYLSFADAQKKQWFLKVYHKLLAEDIQLAGMDMLQHFRYSPHKISVESTIAGKETDTVSLEMRVLFGDEELTLAELQKMILAGQKSVLLKDGSLGILDEEWLHNYGAIIKHGKISGKNIVIPRWLAFSEDDSQQAVLKPVLSESWKKKWQQWQHNAETIYPVPSSVRATLRPYQHKGFEWMLLLEEAGAGGCLADDMGLGKTLQSICFLVYQLDNNPAFKHLIVCPSSLIYNWQQELQKFAPHIPTLVFHGSGRNAAMLQEDANQIIITSYGTVRSDIEQLKAISFGVVVLDESHYIKNPAASTTHAVGQLRAKTRFALSGTPVMNNTFDLYAQFNFILPRMFGSQEFFRKEYAGSIDRERDPDKIIALKKLTAPFILRRTKQQVAEDLPSKTEMVMWCNMKPPQKLLYEDIKTQIRNSIFLDIKNEGFNKSKLAILQGIMKLRQLCNSPLLLPAEEQTCSDSVKTDLLMNELCNDLKDHKVLVFSQFTGMLRLLAEACQKQGIDYFQLDGQTPPDKRIEMVTRFQQEDNKTNVFLLSLRAGNTGFNLTAADYVFLFDPWWNTAVQQQAIDRTHRIGQTKNVFAYKMICKNTIEEKIVAMQQRKKQLADDLISEDESFLKSLTEEDIAYLFS